MRHYSSLEPLPEHQARQPLTLAIPRPAPRVRAGLHSAQPLIDPKGRIAIKRLTDQLGWDATTLLVLRIQGTTLQVRRASEGAIGNPVRLDSHARFGLSTALCLTLGVEPGHQVQVIADTSTSTLTVLSLARALEVLLEMPQSDAQAHAPHEAREAAAVSEA